MDCYYQISIQELHAYFQIVSLINYIFECGYIHTIPVCFTLILMIKLHVNMFSYQCLVGC